MPRAKPTSSLDQLRALQMRERELQLERQALEEQAVCEMASLLIAAEALSMETDVLLGGVLEVVSQARVGSEKTEAWRADFAVSGPWDPGVLAEKGVAMRRLLRLLRRTQDARIHLTRSKVRRDAAALRRKRANRAQE